MSTKRPERDTSPEKVGAVIGTVKLTHKAEELGPLLGLGRNTIYALIRSGALRSIRVGRKILIPASAITDFLNGEKN